MSNRVAQFIGDACGYNPILQPHSVCREPFVIVWPSAVAGGVNLPATLSLVNLRSLLNHCAFKVKRMAFFLSVTPICGVNNWLKLPPVDNSWYPQRPGAKFSTFGGVL